MLIRHEVAQPDLHMYENDYFFKLYTHNIDKYCCRLCGTILEKYTVIFQLFLWKFDSTPRVESVTKKFQIYL